MSLERAASVPFPVPYMGRENISVRFKSVDLLWKPAGAMVRFILVDHPQASGAFGRLIRIPFLDGRYATAQASQW